MKPLEMRRDVTLHMALRAEKRGDLKPVEVNPSRRKLYLNGKAKLNENRNHRDKRPG